MIAFSMKHESWNLHGLLWCSPLARSAKPTRTRATVLTDGTAARFSRATQTVSSIGEPSFSPK